MLLKKYETISIWHEKKGVLNVNLKDIGMYLEQPLFHKSKEAFEAKEKEAFEVEKKKKKPKQKKKAGKNGEKKLEETKKTQGSEEDEKTQELEEDEKNSNKK